MKKFFHLLLQEAKRFLEDEKADEVATPEELAAQTHKEAIQLALFKKAAIHVIYSNQKSITGEIIKWDTCRQQLIVKNFKKNMSAIIRLRDIKRITLVPDTIKKSQKLDQV